MILYYEDWAKYPRAIVDTTTTNTTWIKYASLLKAMGVKNWMWPLALLNPDIRGLDPRDPDLTLEQKLAIATECKLNPIYYQREVSRVKAGGGFINVRMNRAMGAMFFLFYSSINFSVVIQRQQGKTTGVDCIRTDYIWLRSKKTESFLYTKDMKLRGKNIRSVKEMRDDVPQYIIPAQKKDADNTEMLECKALGNVMWSAVGNKDVEASRKVARGNTITVSHTDEAPYIPNVHYGLPSLLTATTKARKDAKAAGTIYCNIITTTPGILGTPEGDYIYNLIHDGMYWNECLMDCKDRDAAEEMVLNNAKSRMTMVNVTLSHRQLGISDEEQLKIVAETGNNNEEEINRDFYNAWLRSMPGVHPLTKELLQVVRGSEMDPVWVETSDSGFIIRWYKDKPQIETYKKSDYVIIGLDSAELIGRDGNVLIFQDSRTMEVIGTSTVSTASLHFYSLWLKDIMLEMPHAVLIPERKSSAMAIIDTVAAFLIAASINPFTRIFNYIANNPYEMPNDYAVIERFDFYKGNEIYERLKKHMGFMTTGGSRQHLYSTVLAEASESTAHLVKDKTLITEINELNLKNNRVDHAAQGHDDHVIGWLLGHWFVRHAKNLQFYSLNERACLTLVSDKGALLTPEQMERYKELTKLNEEISLLKSKLLAAPDTIDQQRLEVILRTKVERAGQLGETAYTLDSIMREIEENRVTKRSLRSAVLRHNARRNSW